MHLYKIILNIKLVGSVNLQNVKTIIGHKPVHLRISISGKYLFNAEPLYKDNIKSKKNKRMRPGIPPLIFS